MSMNSLSSTSQCGPIETLTVPLSRAQHQHGDDVDTLPLFPLSTRVGRRVRPRLDRAPIAKCKCLLTLCTFAIISESIGAFDLANLPTENSQHDTKNGSNYYLRGHTSDFVATENAQTQQSTMKNNHDGLKFDRIRRRMQSRRGDPLPIDPTQQAQDGGGSGGGINNNNNDAAIGNGNTGNTPNTGAETGAGYGDYGTYMTGNPGGSGSTGGTSTSNNNIGGTAAAGSGGSYSAYNSPYGSNSAASGSLGGAGGSGSVSSSRGSYSNSYSNAGSAYGAGASTGSSWGASSGSSYGTGSYSSAWGTGAATGSATSSSKLPTFHIPSINISLIPAIFFLFLFSLVGMLLTAHKMEHSPEGTYANCCRVSLHTVSCIAKVIYNLYHCRLGDIPQVVFASELEEEGEFTDEEIERMKLRPGIERALDVEHRKALRKVGIEMNKIKIPQSMKKNKGKSKSKNGRSVQSAGNI